MTKLEAKSLYRRRYKTFIQKLENSEESDYRLFAGVRATFVFFPRIFLPNNEELSLLCKETRPMMYTQLWRELAPRNIPVSTKQIDVIGFKKQNLLEDEDFASDFDRDFDSDSTVAIPQINLRITLKSNIPAHPAHTRFYIEDFESLL